MFTHDKSHDLIQSLKEFTFTMVKEQPEKIINCDSWNNVLDFYERCDSETLKRFPLEDLKNELLLGLSGVRKLTEHILPMSFWSPDCRCLNLNRAIFSTKLLTNIVQCCTKLKSLNLDNILKIDDSMIKIISNSCLDLEELSVEGCRMLTDDCLHYLTNIKKLNQFNIGGCFNITVGGLYQFISIHPNNHNFINIHITDINDSILMILPKFCPQLTSLTINFSTFTDTAFISFVKSLKTLHYLSFAWSHGFTDECLYAIAYGEQELETLNITGCSTLTSTAIFEMILARCTLLESSKEIEEQAAKNAKEAGYINDILPLPSRNLKHLITKYTTFVADDYSNVKKNCTNIDIIY